MKPSDVAVSIGHFRMPGAVALNLALLRKHNSPDHPILVTDDVSPAKSLLRLAAECEKYNAELRPGTTKYNHVGGDLRAFYHGLNFAQERGCKYLMKISQRAVFDLPGWLMKSAKALEAWGYPAAGNRAAIGEGHTVAHVRTSTILLRVKDWVRPDVMEQLKPQQHGGISCEWLIGKILQGMGGTMLTLPDLPANLLKSTKECPWHDDPESEAHYRRLAEREGIDLGEEFHCGGSGSLPDGSPDPSYRP